MAKTEKIIKAKVAKRKSVDIEGKLYGPGSVIELPMSEAEDLYEKGFIAEPDEEPAADAGTSGVTIEEQE